MTEECSNLRDLDFFFSFQFYRFLLHELWSSVVRCIHKTIMFLVILTHLLFNVPLCSSFGDLVLLSSPAASFSNCPTGERSYWICQALLYLVHLLTRILWQLPHEQLLICGAESWHNHLYPEYEWDPVLQTMVICVSGIASFCLLWRGFWL